MPDRIKRQFVDIAEGQAHFRYCGNPDAPALVMLHGSPGSSYSLAPLMGHLARDRYVVALDTLGNGDSSPGAMDEPDIAYLAGAHLRAIDVIGLKTFDLYGFHSGATISAEISIRHGSRVRRLVLDGVSAFDSSERDNLLDNGQAPDIPVDYEGTQFVKAWTMVRDAHLFYPWWDRRAERRRMLGLPSAEYLHGEALEVLKACRTYYKSYRASISYPKRQRLPKITNPTLAVACPTDQLFDHLDTVVGLIPGAKKAVYPGSGSGSYLSELARIMLEFLST
jgi:pimeloyl-ACP methyl ester carboxylesterase